MSHTVTRRFGERVARHIRSNENQPPPTEQHIGLFEGRTRFFELLEDFVGNGPHLAKLTYRDNSVHRDDIMLYSYANMLDGAQAGYKGQCTYIDGEWVIAANPCVATCDHDGVIDPGAPPTGTVGASYSHSVGLTNITSPSASGLPPGLSMNGSGAISGTPTAAGRYRVTFTGTSGSCTVTKIGYITIQAA